MNNIQNVSWEQIAEWARRYSQYILVGVIFAVFVFYNIVITPQSPFKKSKSSNRSAGRIAWDITTEKPEKIFTGVLQGRSGDWYRLGVSTRASYSVRIDVSLYSVFNDDVAIGFLDIPESADFQYHEILFQIPTGTFSDIRFVLRGEGAPGLWSYTGVKLSEFALSRLNVSSKFEADRLMPTLAGNTEHIMKTFAAGKQISDSRVIFENSFTADADFIENIRVNTNEKSRQGSYVLELREKAGADSGNQDISIKRIILEPGEFGSDQDEWGNQSLTLPALLERGKEYTVSLKNTGGVSVKPILSPLEGLQGEALDDTNITAIVFGRYAYTDDSALLSGAKVEDFGGEILYSYSLSGEENDFFDLFDTEGSVRFDTKEKMIAGKQKGRTSFTYRFFTVRPFEKFMLAARQAGDNEKEVKLEYSFDNAFWREVPSTQEKNEPQIFSLTLSGNGNQNIVYIRASYNGEDKKTGSFGLDQLSVRAKLIRK